MGRTIRDLEKEFANEISKLDAIDYQLFQSSEKGGKVIMGPFIEIDFPDGTIFSRQLVNCTRFLVKTYYGPVKRIKRERNVNIGNGNRIKSLLLEFE